MKRFFSWLLVLCMVLTLLPGNVFAAEIVRSGNCGAEVTWTLDSDGLLTISGSGNMSVNLATTFYSIRSQVKSAVITPGVTSIGRNAFAHFSNMSSVSIPDTVTFIDWQAFTYCSSLTAVTIPDSVVSIDNNAFSYCSNLEQVTLSSKLTAIPYRAFTNCHKLSAITIPESVTSIGDDAFKECNQVSELHIPNGVTTIGSSAFSGCKMLDDISLPDSVTNIGESAFEGCRALKSVKLPKDIIKINNRTFALCTSLPSIELPGSVTSIGFSAFNGCTSLTDIQIPSNVTQIGDSAFHYCTSLESVALPDGISSIAASLFSGCRSLTSIQIPDSVTTIGDSAFAGCSSLAEIDIPDQVTELGKDCFHQCSSLRKVDISSSIPKINEYTFYGCENLSEITLPYSITYIGIHAFSGCKSLTRLDLPGSIGSIDSNAFYNCSGLKSVVFREGITSIGSRAFEDCISMEHIQLPNSIKTIGEYAFNGCRALSSVKYIGSEEEWNSINIMRYNDPLFGAVLTVAPEECPFEISEDFSPRFGLEHTYGFANFKAEIGSNITDRMITFKSFNAIVAQMRLEKSGLTSMGGQCYGMSLTVAGSMAYNFPNENSFKNENENETSVTLSDVTDKNWKSSEVDFSAEDYIKCAELFQIFPVVQNNNDVSGLIRAVNDFSNNTGEPVLLNMYDDSDETGHTVLVMGIEHETDAEAALLVYDSNSPGKYGRALFHKDENGNFTKYDYCFYNPYECVWTTQRGKTDFHYTNNATSNFINFYQGRLRDEDLYLDYTHMLLIDSYNNQTMILATPQQFDELFLPIRISHNDAASRALDASMYWTKTDHVDLVVPEGEADATISFASFDSGVTVTVPGGTTASLAASEGASAEAELSLPKSDDFSVEYLTAAADAEDAVTIRIEGRGQNVQSAMAADGIQVHADDAENVKVTYSVDNTVMDTVSVGTLHGDMTITEDKNHLQVSGDVEPPAPQDNPFTDVPADQYYYDPVLWAVNHTPQITKGTSDTTFSPNATCTRGQVVTFLWRAMGEPEPTSTANKFSDVATSDYFYKAVLWAVEKGITLGTSDTTFSPNDPCTRAHVVTFLWRAEGQPSASGANPFADVASGQYYYSAVLWAVSKNITQGTSAATFSPDNPCTRAQIVTFLYRDMK